MPQSRNSRSNEIEGSSRSDSIPIPNNKSSLKPNINEKNSSPSEYSNDSQGIFSTLISKSKSYTSNLAENSSPEDKKNVSGMTSLEPSLLQRSITVGNRSLNKMKSLSNFRSPEPVPPQIPSKENLFSSQGLDNNISNDISHEQDSCTETALYPEDKNKSAPKKIRSARSEFFNTSKTFSSMLPKMDKLNPFYKSASKGHKLSRSITDASFKHAIPDVMTRSESNVERPALAIPSKPIISEKEASLVPDKQSYAAGFVLEDASASNTDLTDTELLIYGAFISEISFNFYKQLINQGQFSWPKVFSGLEAIDLICTILDTSDRKLALLIGRTFNSQKFITHVSHDLDLVDDAYETYKLDTHFEPLDTLSENEAQSILPSGVFTLLTDCYSPTCSSENNCYSISCPRRTGNVPEEVLKNANIQNQPESNRKNEQLWECFVSPKILESVTERERKRQEIIFELIYTERDFVSDLKIMHELYLVPLLCNDLIDETQREDFIKEVFMNLLDMQLSSFELSSGLTQIQSQTPVIESIGRFFLDHLICFEPFKEYGANQVYSKRRLAQEIQKSTELEEFLKNQARLPECRKLPIQSFLARPTTRLGRYPLLLEAVLNCTEEGNSDIEDIPKVISAIKEVLSEINVLAGAADNRVKIDDILTHLSGPSESINEIALNQDNRLLIREGVFKKKSGVEFVEINVFLFDAYFLMTKKRKSTKNTDNFEYKISKKPIKLDLLILSDQDEHILSKPATASAMPLVAIETHRTTSFPLTITHLGRQGGTYVLYCSTLTEKQRWKSIILEQREKVLQRSLVFITHLLADKTTCPVAAVLCSAICESEHIILLGSEGGIYAKSASANMFRLVIELDKVRQIEILEENDIILVLSDRTLYTLPLNLTLKESREVRLVPEKLKSNIDFFSVGACLGKTLICAVKTTALSTTGRLYQPNSSTSKKATHTPKSFLTSIGSKKTLEFFKEFYIPSESFNVYFLKSKLCVACAKGFEILDLASLLPQGLLNPTDPNLDFVFLRGETVKPVAFFRIRDGVFFVCYDEFGFFVDRAGQLETSASIINWKGHPKSFSMIYPYILAFDPSFIEVRSLESGELKQIIPTDHSLTLRTGSEAIHFVEQTLSLDSWQLKEIHMNRAHPSIISFRKTLKDARTTKRRGIIGSYSTT